MINVGDIGGTKSQFQIFNNHHTSGQFVSFENRNFESVDLLLDRLPIQPKLPDVTACYLAVAGPVKNNTCTMTNLNWLIDGKTITSRYPGAEVKIINDLEATALSIPYLEERDVHFIQGKCITPFENISVLSVGTGLGQATLTMNKESKLPPCAITGEGGHCDFAPHTSLELELLHYIWKQNQSDNNKQPVCLEQLISGQGLPSILNFFKHTTNNYELQNDPLPNANINAEILRLADTDPNSIYRKTVDLFLDLIANELGNMALRTLSRGGAIVAGGMAPRILPFINQVRFLSRFSDKDTFSSLLKTFPVAFCLNPKAPLIGLYSRYACL